MRWKYLIPRVLIVGLVWGFFFWAFDPILRWAVCQAGARVNGAKVDVANLQTQFFPPTVELTGVQIADQGKSGRNLLQFDTFRLQLAGGPLARRKLVIDEGSMTGLIWNAPRADSGQLEDRESFRLGEHLPLKALRKQVSELGNAWLKEALNAAKAQVDPKQLETVQVSTALKEQWIARFQMYEQRVKAIEDRAKALKDVKAEGNTLQKIETYRQAAIEVQKLLAEAQQMRQELSQLGPLAGADLQKIEAAKQRDLQKVQEKLAIFKLDQEAISEALLGPELLSALEQSLDWVTWTKEHIGRLTASREPERSRGVDVPFPKPEDPYPDFLIRQLNVSGTARVNGEMVPYLGTLANVTNDPKRWGQPVVLDVSTDGTSKIHLTARIDRTIDQPSYEVSLICRLPKPTEAEWGNAEQMAIHYSAAETLWKANLNLVKDQLSGQMTFRQENVKIVPHSSHAPAPVQVASIEPVSFEWDPQQELHRALASVLDQVTEVEATLALSGTVTEPKWELSSPLGPQIATGVQTYLASELTRRKAQLADEMERMAGEQIADFRGLLTEKFRASSGRLNVAESQANELLQKFAGRPLDVRGLFRQ